MERGEGRMIMAVSLDIVNAVNLSLRSDMAVLEYHEIFLEYSAWSPPAKIIFGEKLEYRNMNGLQYSREVA